jgi:hypothetical protein
MRIWARTNARESEGTFPTTELSSDSRGFPRPRWDAGGLVRTESPSDGGSLRGGSVVDLASDASAEKGRGGEQQKEDTARRLKRFSLPAVALQTTSVMARIAEVPAASDGRVAAHKKGKRFSLVLGKGGGPTNGSTVDGEGETATRELSKGVAAGKLNELLSGQRRAWIPPD